VAASIFGSDGSSRIVKEIQMSKQRALRTASAVAAIGVIAAVGAAGGILSTKRLEATTALTSPTAILEGRSLPGSFAPVIERVAPAVVSIRVTGHGEVSGGDNGPNSEIPEPFKRFFGEEFGKRFGFEFGRPNDALPHRAPKVQGMGSGFFVDAEGHVVTNNHVVADAERIEVVLRDGETLPASLVGRDPKTDLALLKVKSDKALPFVSFGDSSEARVGDWVIALGSPFGLGHTATTGIVSARGRDIGAGPYDDFLQIDAAINKGNSGGPAFNVRGEVVGVNTAIISPSGTSAGIGFAIPANMAKTVVAQLKANGKVERGWLGVNIQRVTPDIAEGLGLSKPEGALVAGVTENGPAAGSGLMQGDVIVAVNGERIEHMRELPRLIASIAAGSDAKLTVYRNGAERSVTVRIGTMPETDKIASVDTDEGGKVRLGMTLASVDRDLRTRFRLPKEAAGVLIVDVDPDGVAAEKGLRPGDLIRRVSGQEAKQPADIAKAVEKAVSGNRKAVLILVSRSGNDLYVALPVRDA
jgi:serine protease Do